MTHDSMGGQNPYTRFGAANIVGKEGEEAVHNVIAKKYQVAYGNGTYDLLVDNRVTVEVKTALPTKGNGKSKQCWQFALHRADEKPVEEHLLVLLCKTMEGEHWYFVIPVDDNIRALKKIDITSRPGKYKGQWSSYLGQWHYLDSLVAKACVEQWPDPREEKIPF